MLHLLPAINQEKTPAIMLELKILACSVLMAFVGASVAADTWDNGTAWALWRSHVSDIIGGKTLDFSNLTERIRSKFMDIQTNLAQSHVHLSLYTGKSPDPEKILPGNLTSVEQSKFDKSKKTKFCIHGYLCNTKKGSGCDEIKNALLATSDYNVILVDWSAFDSKLLYPLDVAFKVPIVGRMLADMLETLLQHGADADDMHIIGHSLGSHIAGHAGSLVLAPLGKGAITGLDPAGPLYNSASQSHRLSPDDARFVEAIHTDGGLLGIAKAVAQLDVYYNGGMHPQPGCALDPFGPCSHCFVFAVYVHAIKNPTGAGELLATECESQEKLRRKECDGNPQTPLGLGVNQRARGVYYIESTFKGRLSDILYCLR